MAVLKLNKGDEVRFKNGLLLYYQGPNNSTSGWFKENEGSTKQPKLYKNIIKINGKLLEVKINKPIPKLTAKKYLNNKLDVDGIPEFGTFSMDNKIV